MSPLNLNGSKTQLPFLFYKPIINIYLLFVSYNFGVKYKPTIFFNLAN